MTDSKKHHSPLHGVLQRLPALVGLVVGLLSGGEEVFPLPIILIIVSLYYLVSGLVRKDLPTRKALGIHIAIALGFIVLGVVTLLAHGGLSYYIMAAAWLLHASWDFYLFRKNVAVPRWLTEFCVVFDILLAALLIVTAVRP